ncbi:MULTISPECIES: 5-dehydro-4-deoxy-D-glucuronate isomerase [Thermoanaerobacterium]|uniref:4-deoxy-L-threo-5-hexosulose-uronate ketol-isomerase n=2 Tax=Thermoanaerobacterium thermosaccharolyticum TaxID=1517 RepID=D9TSJ3_THETC|nr:MULTISPECIES: 5-dehydro-4-deoxy-D-glucuronate isomerase [Thermoanaerobacterium]ADL69848.1 4-deoxy-L-threo-5-hexosulose-uronate ketol-isomerase [Thermoanaerobacterium thermosaccharolyticum DSM 571]AST57043.1 5-keto-4-deoxyuronate isomerase [Thermoanaerobacterium thermosaccharolyticum]MBE0068801.1 5-dehydro-4-deoxy-D-glucuronate isomerase [Thermoanaerobacterium thermosaccharolyticum]MBE0227134.1 5-dehydro-4-deoxy-D-glucuronate isomerase [Thermoanaerobacterium thermosaccharolyticum]WKV10032.1 
MEVRYASHYEDVKHYDTTELRKHFLIENLFTPGKLYMVYSHVDRIIVAGAVPTDKPLYLEASKELGSNYFLERREMGIINIGGTGIVNLDGERYELNNSDGLYVGMGIKEVSFESLDANNPAKFYINSATAHKSYPTVKIGLSEANKVKAGTDEECNKRTINQYVHPAVCQSCQLVMGMTILEPGSIWNTMPCHTHDRRMEVYLYFNMDEDNVVFHFMGTPNETRHIVVKNEQAVISPSWSIHSGVGTKNYTFIWGMVGENQTFTDMDEIPTKDLR